MKPVYRKCLSTAAFLSFVAIAMSCRNNNVSLTERQADAVKSDVARLADSIAANITGEGPIAWLKYFEPSRKFFMASDGQLVFDGHAAAQKFITTTLVKTISHIKLKWTDVRVDPLAPTLAVLAANFHEDLTDSLSKTTSIDGYFTAIAEQTPAGWQLRNAHWSTKH